MWSHKSPGPRARAGDDSCRREYISVIADYSADGAVRPVSIRFADGPAYAVERVISVTEMSTTKHDGAESRYYVRIGGREHYLYFEGAEQNRQPRWFVYVDL